MRDAAEIAPLAARKEAGASRKKAKTTGARRGDNVRSRVLKAALEIFGAYGFDGASTRAVAQRAGVTHTLVLYHFQTKDNLWIAALEHALGNYTDPLRENLETSVDRPAAEGLRTFVEQFVRLSARLPQIHRILMMEGKQDTARLRWVLDNHLRNHFTAVRDLIRRGQEEGSVRQTDPARLYYLIIGAGGTPFTIPTEYKQFTGRDIFSETEIDKTIAFILNNILVDQSGAR